MKKLADLPFDRGKSYELGPHIPLIIVSNTIKYINLDMSLTKSILVKCVRQPSGTNLCAYYACENLHADVTEGIDFQTVSKQYTENSFIAINFVMMIYIHIDLLLRSSKQSEIGSHRLNA
jgi:hypothetical protein